MAKRTLAIALVGIALVAAPVAHGREPKGSQQVLIEARIAEVDRTVARDLGIRLGAFASDAEGAGASPFPGPRAGAAYDPQGPAYDPSADPGGIWFGNPSGFLLDLSLLAGDARGQTRILQQPRITTLDGQEATIFVGDELELPAASGGGSDVGVELSDFGLELRVTPRVTPGGRILMDLGVSMDDLAVPQDAAPRLETRSAETTVTLPSGGTLVVGGLLADRSRETAGRVPVLGQLPILGWLFRSERWRSGRTQLLVFVTPTIVDEFGRSHPATSGGPVVRVPIQPPRVDPQLKEPPHGPNPVQQPSTTPGQPIQR